MYNMIPILFIHQPNIKDMKVEPALICIVIRILSFILPCGATVKSCAHAVKQSQVIKYRAI